MFFYNKAHKIVGPQIISRARKKIIYLFSLLLPSSFIFVFLRLSVRLSFLFDLIIKQLLVNNNCDKACEGDMGVLLLIQLSKKITQKNAGKSREGADWHSLNCLLENP